MTTENENDTQTQAEYMEEESITDILACTNSQAFSLNGGFGFDKRRGVQSWQNELGEYCIIYIMSNIIVFYNLKTKKFENYTGHEEKINCFNIDRNGKIMVTSDKDSVFIWDLKCSESTKPVILRILHKPFRKNPKMEIALAAISPCGKYLIVASKSHALEMEDTKDEEQFGHLFKYWEWALGKENYDYSFLIPKKYGTIRNMTFSCNKDEETYFAITFYYNVIFATINPESSTISIFTPEQKRFGTINQTCYLENSALTMSCTNKGNLVIWKDIESEIKKQKPTNAKVVFKIAKLIEGSVNDVKCFDNYIITADDTGEIRFYDYGVRILYICEGNSINANSILSICPGIKNNKYDMGDKRTAMEIKKSVTDYTRLKKKFKVRNFIIVSSIGGICFCDVSSNRYRSILFKSIDTRVTGEVFPNKPWTVKCSLSGHLRIYNHNNRMEISEHQFYPQLQNKNETSAEKPVISFCKLSYDGNIIAVGFTNGCLWLLDPISAEPLYPEAFQFTAHAIKKIVFNENDTNFFAIADADYALSVIYFDKNEWNIIAKYRYHCLPIVNIFFVTMHNVHYIITIGNDRMYVRYRVSDDNKSLTSCLDTRIEQSPKITSAEVYDSSIMANSSTECEKVILTATDSFKFVFYDAFTAAHLFTYVGPVFESPITTTLYLPPNQNSKDHFLFMASRKTLAAAILPLDGNPYRYSGVVAHYDSINRFWISNNGTEILIEGANDTGQYSWNFDPDSVKRKFLEGGTGLQPFCRLIPGGKSGWLFKEMQDYFFYLQLMSELSDEGQEKRKVTDYISVSEVPDFMRAVGYFPSDFEIKQILDEIKTTENIWQRISFQDLIKLYINYKPHNGYRIESILKAVKYLMNANIRFAFQDADDDLELKRDQLLGFLTQKGECVTELEGMKLLTELIKPSKVLNRYRDQLSEKEIEKDFKQLNKVFDAFTFCHNILGLDVVDSIVDENLVMAYDVLDPTKIYPSLANNFEDATKESKSNLIEEEDDDTHFVCSD